MEPCLGDMLFEGVGLSPAATDVDPRAVLGFCPLYPPVSEIPSHKPVKGFCAVIIDNRWENLNSKVTG
jgi:hypothetical protein